MKIIQSYWSCHKTNLLESNAGWVSPAFNIMSWALSCLQLKKHYSDVTLYADSTSAKLTSINASKLRLDSVRVWPINSPGLK
jgi:hypothetical protein